MLLLNIIIKMGKIFVILFTISSVAVLLIVSNNLIEFNEQKKQLEYMDDYYVTSMVSSSLIEEEVNFENDEKLAREYYDLTKEQLNGFYIGYNQIYDSESMIIAESMGLDCQDKCFYYANENYLDFNMLYDIDGNRITSDDIDDDEIVLLTVDDFESDTKLYNDVIKDDLDEVIYIESNQVMTYFSLNEDMINYTEYTDIPIFIFGNDSNNEINKSLAAPVTQGSYLVDGDPEELIEETEFEGIIQSESISELLESYEHAISSAIKRSKILTVIYMILIIIFNVQLIIIYVSLNSRDISIKKIEGYPLYRIYDKYLIESISVYMLVIIFSIILGRYSILALNYRFAILIVLFTLEVIELIIVNKLIVNNKFLEIMKGN